MAIKSDLPISKVTYKGVEIPIVKPPVLQSKNVTPDESSHTITADSGYDGLSSVNVSAISSTYVGSGVTKQAAKTVTPTESEQTAVASGVYTTGAVKVGAISSTYVGSGVTKQAAKTWTPGTTNQTIQSGTYLSGTQTIAGDSNLKSENIKDGVQIFGISGSLKIVTYRTGSTDPSSSLGQDGDIFLVI